MAPHTALSYELYPPRSVESRDSLLQTIDELSATSPDYVSVTYSGTAERKQQTLALLDYLVHETKLTPLAHLTCVGHSVGELEHAVRLIVGLGVRGLLALRGDIPAGVSPDALELPFARYLVELIRRVEREDFAHFAGGKLSIGVAAYPQKHPESVSLLQDIEILLAKQRAGADFAITQVYFDNARFQGLLDAAQTAGVNLPIIPGIMPVTSLRRLIRLCELAGLAIPLDLASALENADNKAERHKIGVEYALHQCKAALDSGASGLHFYTFNEHRAVLDVLEHLDIAPYTSRYSSPLKSSQPSHFSTSDADYLPVSTSA